MALSYPAQSTIKRLFAVSGNNCAFPKCPIHLVDTASGKVTGRICHIKAQNEGGARYDANQTNEERHGFENLVLMCPIHHDVIDSDEASFTVERLHQIKSDHEKAFQNDQEPASQIINNFVEHSQKVENVSTTISQNQSGGQTAGQIYNLLQSNNLGDSWEIEMQKKRHSHDSQIFQSANEILSEENLEKIIGNIFGSHRYRDSDILAIEHFIEFARKEKNQFYDDQINEPYIQLTNNLSRLDHFLGISFHVYPENQKSDNMSFRMQPDLNPDIGINAFNPEYSGIYDRLTDDLNDLLENVKQSYIDFRRAIKKKLII